MTPATSIPASPSSRVYGVLSLHTLIAAGTYLVAKDTFREWGPLELMWLRITLATSLYLGVFVVTRRPLLPPHHEIKRLFLLGFLGMPINQGVFLVGLSLSTPAHAAIAYALTPATVLLGAHLFLGEPLTRQKLLGVGVAFTGVAVVLLERGLNFALQGLVGDLLLLVAMVAWAGYTVLTRPLAQKYGALTTTGWVWFAGVLWTLPLGPWVLRPLDQLEQITPRGWLGLAYIVLITSVVAYLLWGYALQRLEAARVAIFTNLQPVVTALLAWVVLGLPISVPTALGGLLVITGVSLIQRRSSVPMAVHNE